MKKKRKIWQPTNLNGQRKKQKYHAPGTFVFFFDHPAGDMDWKGLSAQLLFFKGMLEKLEVEPEIIRHGKFKSAIEPFILDKMSDANRIQTKAFIGSIWNHLLQGIMKQRKIEIDQLNALANNMTVNSAEDAVTAKLIDKLMYDDEVQLELTKRLKQKPDDKVSLFHCQNITK